MTPLLAAVIEDFHSSEGRAEHLRRGSYFGPDINIFVLLNVLIGVRSSSSNRPMVRLLNNDGTLRLIRVESKENG